MRTVYFLFLLLFLAAVAVFAVQNDELVGVRFLNQTLTSRLSLLIGAGYLLGMLSGWTVVGFMKRSMQAVTEHHRGEKG